MLDPTMAASKMYGHANNFLEAYYTVMQPLCRETGLPPIAVDILMFAANNPECATARDICRFRGLKPGIVSFHVDRLAGEGLHRRGRAHNRKGPRIAGGVRRAHPRRAYGAAA